MNARIYLSRCGLCTISFFRAGFIFLADLVNAEPCTYMCGTLVLFSLLIKVNARIYCQAPGMGHGMAILLNEISYVIIVCNGYNLDPVIKFGIPLRQRYVDPPENKWSL